MKQATGFIIAAFIVAGLQPSSVAQVESPASSEPAVQRAVPTPGIQVDNLEIPASKSTLVSMGQDSPDSGGANIAEVATVKLQATEALLSLQNLLMQLKAWFNTLGFHPALSEFLVLLSGLVMMLLISWVGYLVANRLILKLIRFVATKTKTDWDNILLEKKVFARIAKLAPALIIHVLAPVVFTGSDGLIRLVQAAAKIYLVVVLLLILRAVFDAVLIVYQRSEVSKRVPIKGYLQAFMLVACFIGGVFIVSIVMNKEVGLLLMGLGGLVMATMFIFKDSIMGLVAGIQIAANNMVQKGDWIEMKNHGADGDVIDVSLTTVKVQNFDKTIVSVPAHKLITESCRNWRGMRESGGRRIKRSIHIDLHSIGFADEAMLQRFLKFDVLKDYLEARLKEVDEHNEGLGGDLSCLVNGRRLTNIGTYRAYCIAYLKKHPKIHPGMTFLVRQLEPTVYGLPLQIYIFTNDTNWVAYEEIQSDIFDHLLSSLPEFDLKAYQVP